MRTKLFSIILVLSFVLAACATPTEAPVATEGSVATEAPLATKAPVATEAPLATEAPVATEVSVIDGPMVDKPVTIKYWRHFTPAEDESIKKLIEDFKAYEPNVTVEYESIPDNDYFQKLNTSLAAGEAADIFPVYTQMWESYYRKGVMAPVDPTAFGFKSVDEMISNMFKPNTLDFAVKDGVLYSPGLPEYGTWIQAYNKDSFDLANVPYPDADTPMTWDQFFELAVKTTLKDADGKMTQMGDGSWIASMDNFTGAAYIMDPLFRQHGGQPFDEVTGKPINREVWDKVAQIMFDASLKGKYGYLDPGFPAGTNAHPELFGGRIANMQAGQWAVGWGLSVNPDLKLGWYPLPQVDAEHNQATNSGWVWVINKESSPEKQIAAQRWLEFVQKPENAMYIFDKTALVMPLLSEEYDQYLIEKFPDIKLFLRENSRGVGFTWGDKGEEHWEIIRKMSEAIFKSGTDPKTAVDNAWKEMELLGE